MNVYDEVNNLARAIKESKEYLEYKQIKSELFVDPDLKKQVDESIKSKVTDYSINYDDIDKKALADYYLFNEDIEFPKLK